MEFKKYPSIENSYRTKEVNDAKLLAPNMIYSVTEKIHGCNWSIYISKAGEVRFAKRTDFIKPEEKFYNYRQAMAMLEPNFNTIIIDYNEECDIIIYGELFGGAYLHKDVTQISAIKRIQKGVFYCPDIEFCCFDIKIAGKFLSQNDTARFCKKYGIFYVKSLFEGTLDECLSYTNEFQTTLPARLGLPEIPNNVCEGVVIKPNLPLFFSNGARVMFKNKNNKFKENQRSIRPKIQKSPKNMSPEVIDYIDTISEYITENRLCNVLSKIGEVTEKDFGLIVRIFNSDVLEEFYRDNNSFLLLDKSDQKQVTKKANVIIGNLIRNNLTKIVGGDL